MEGIVTTAETDASGTMQMLQGLLASDESGFLPLMEIGARLHEEGAAEASLAAFEAALARCPDEISGWHAVATLCAQLGRPKAALAACNQALKRNGSDAVSLFNTGVVLASFGDNAAALHCYERVLEVDPQNHGALLNFPLLLAKIGQLEAALGVACEACKISPNDADFVFNRGELLTTAGRHVEALDSYMQAIALRPGEVRFAIAAAVASAACGNIVVARAELLRLSDEHPAEFAAFKNPLRTDVAAAYPELEAGRIALIAAYEPYRRCDWSQRQRFVDLYRCLAFGEDGTPMNNPDMPFLGIGLGLDGEVRLKLARSVARRISASVAGQTLVRGRRPRGLRLRIGYLSGDFRQHATACLMSRLPALHNRDKFEVYVYTTGPDDESTLREEIKAGADRFCDVAAWDAPSIAQRMALDGIDILVDLAGYTLYAKTAVLALRPAPLQVSYLAYLQTMGAPWVDYTLLDREVLLPSERPFWQEHIAYLPDTLYMCNDRQQDLPRMSRADFGLPADAFVYCCFNAPWKIDPVTFSSWMEILRNAPGAVLWLYDDTGHAPMNLKQAALNEGVSSERLFFTGRVGYLEHLARFPLADLFLDTFDCNAHTTCIESLAMGLPIVVKAGEHVVSRVSSSLTKAHGVPDMVTHSCDGYVATALRYFADAEWREQILIRVRDRSTSRLLCSERRVREIEHAYETMWERHKADLPPADFDVPPLD